MHPNVKNKDNEDVNDDKGEKAETEVELKTICGEGKAKERQLGRAKER